MSARGAGAGFERSTPSTGGTDGFPQIRDRPAKNHRLPSKTVVESKSAGWAFFEYFLFQAGACGIRAARQEATFQTEMKSLQPPLGTNSVDQARHERCDVQAAK